MLEKNRFLAIKNLAKDIRKENEKIFKKFSKDSMEDAIKEKDEFIDSVIDSMEIAFSDGEQGKEEKQIFRANILIPDDDHFFEDYSKDKNIRNLMNKYAVSIEDIMSKITELNIYGKYIDSFAEEDEEEDKNDFVNEMVNLSSKDAESLLDEIEDLSNAMDELTDKEDKTLIPEVLDEKDKPLTPEVLDEKVGGNEKPTKKQEKPKENIDVDLSLDDTFENISNAVSGFVDEYSKIQESLNKANAKIETFGTEKKSLESKINDLQAENNTLKKNNLDCVNELNKIKETRNLTENENITLKEQIKVMQRKLKQSSDLLKKIYNSIPKK